MKTFASTFLALCVLFLAAPASSAEQKIATIDLKKIFDEYFLTKIEDAKIKDEAAIFDKDRKKMTEDLQKVVEDYKKAVEDANNQAISAEEREKRKKTAEGRIVEINDIEQQVKQFDRTARTTLEERQTRARDKILKQIQGIVNARAKAGGYSLVLDTAGEAMSRTTVVFYTSGLDDLTAPVIKELNANAPADLPKTGGNGAKEEKK